VKFVPHGSNVCEIRLEGRTTTILCVSYETPVAAIIKGQCFSTDKKWSVTTSRHINQFRERHGFTESVKHSQSFFDNLLENLATEAIPAPPRNP